MKKLLCLLTFLLIYTSCTNGIYLNKKTVDKIYLEMPDTAYELIADSLPAGTKDKVIVKTYLKNIYYYNDLWLGSWENE